MARPRRAKRTEGGAARSILVIHGPNLNLLGVREPELYGRVTLAEIDAELTRRAEGAGARLESFQSNGEGEIVTRIQQARGAVDGIVINPAAYTHTSVAIRDALLAAEVPAVEVHLSNLARREPFRHESITAAACIGQVSGFGAASYYLALEAVLMHLETERTGR